MPQTSLPAACISAGRITAARNRNSKKNSWENSSHHSAFLTYQVVCRRKRKTAGKTRSSLPTDQRRRNTTIPGMASRSEEVQQARHSPPGKEKNQSCCCPSSTPSGEPRDPTRAQGLHLRAILFNTKDGRASSFQHQGAWHAREGEHRRGTYSLKSGKYQVKQVCNSLNIITTHPAPLHKITWNPVRAACR